MRAGHLDAHSLTNQVTCAHSVNPDGIILLEDCPGRGVVMLQPQTPLLISWDEFARAIKTADTECPADFGDVEEAISYVRTVLGDDYLDEVRQLRKHPFRDLVFLSWPGLRSEFLDWIAHLRRVRECPNVDRILQDLRVANKCVHAYGVIKLAGRMRQRGFDLTFESEPDAHFQLRPDARICVPDTDESFFLEFSCQSLAQNQMTGFEAMAACSKPVDKHFETLKCVFRLRTIPAPKHLQEIVRNIEVAVESVRATGRLAEVIEEGTLEMAICRLPGTEELEAWCAGHGVSLAGHEGPRDNTNHLERLKQKIRQKQRQLPSGYPNVLAIENHNIFVDCPAIPRLISELQEEIYRHPNIAFLLLEGSNGSGRAEPPILYPQGEHRFERRFRRGQVGHTLLCMNKYALKKPSVNLVSALSEAVFAGATATHCELQD